MGKHLYIYKTSDTAENAALFISISFADGDAPVESGCTRALFTLFGVGSGLGRFFFFGYVSFYFLEKPWEIKNHVQSARLTLCAVLDFSFLRTLTQFLRFLAILGLPYLLADVATLVRERVLYKNQSRLRRYA